MRVRFTPQAWLSVREKHTSWEQHREKASALFVEELSVIVRKLRDGTDAERQPFGARGGRIVWGILMPKTRNHVYYRVDDAGDVEVLLAWNAIAGRMPDV